MSLELAIGGLGWGGMPPFQENIFETFPIFYRYIFAAFINGKVLVGSDNQTHDASSHNSEI